MWGLEVALAAVFLLASGAKLAGAPSMVAFFAAIGVGQWFPFVTGLLDRQSRNTTTRTIANENGDLTHEAS